MLTTHDTIRTPPDKDRPQDFTPSTSCSGHAHPNAQPFSICHLVKVFFYAAEDFDVIDVDDDSMMTMPNSKYANCKICNLYTLLFIEDPKYQNMKFHVDISDISSIFQCISNECYFSCLQ